MTEAYQPYQSQSPPQPVGFICPFCRTTTPPMTYVKVSLAGWITFILLLLSCFGIVLAWVGLLMKESYKVCQGCGIKLG